MGTPAEALLARGPHPGGQPHQPNSLRPRTRARETSSTLPPYPAYGEHLDTPLAQRFAHDWPHRQVRDVVVVHDVEVDEVGPGTQHRVDFLADVVRAVFDRIDAGRFELDSVAVRALGAAVAGRRSTRSGALTLVP